MIEFFVPGPPVAQQRAKTVFVKGRVVGKRDPEQCKVFKNHVADRAFEAIRGCYKADTPIGVEFTFWLPRPPSVSIKKRPYPVKKPDIDNLFKGVADGMENVAYSTDSQIVSETTHKRYADYEQPVGVQVKIWAITRGRD